jgi:hypothetical protein
MIEKIFAKNLAEKLVEKIYGKIVVKIFNDEVHVYIKCWSDIDCEVVLENFTERVLHGWSTDYAAYEVLEQYRKCVMRRYFK